MEAMEDPNNDTPRRDEEHAQTDNEKEKQEKKIDEQLEQTFPASDPPSYSRPGNDFDEEDE